MLPLKVILLYLINNETEVFHSSFLRLWNQPWGFYDANLSPALCVLYHLLASFMAFARKILAVQRTWRRPFETNISRIHATGTKKLNAVLRFISFFTPLRSEHGRETAVKLCGKDEISARSVHVFKNQNNAIWRGESSQKLLGIHSKPFIIRLRPSLSAARNWILQSYRLENNSILNLINNRAL